MSLFALVRLGRAVPAVVSRAVRVAAGARVGRAGPRRLLRSGPGIRALLLVVRLRRHVRDGLLVPPPAEQKVHTHVTKFFES